MSPEIKKLLCEGRKVIASCLRVQRGKPFVALRHVKASAASAMRGVFILGVSQ